MGSGRALAPFGLIFISQATSPSANDDVNRITRERKGLGGDEWVRFLASLFLVISSRPVSRLLQRNKTGKPSPGK